VRRRPPRPSRTGWSARPSTIGARPRSSGRSR
jgi:hypothetical protein